MKARQDRFKITEKETLSLLPSLPSSFDFLPSLFPWSPLYLRALEFFVKFMFR